MKLTESDLIHSIRSQAIQGKKHIGPPKKYSLPKTTMQKLKEADISTDEYLAMLVYAKHLPRGKRELKMNFKELRKQLVSEVQDSKAYLTDVSGLQLGGTVAMQGSTKPLSQQAHIYNIKNRARKNTKPVPFVNYPYFKNHFEI